MDSPNQLLIRLLHGRYYWLTPLISWLIIVALSLAWNLSRLQKEVQDIAQEQGRIMYQMVHQTKLNPQLMQNAPDLFKRQAVDDIRYRLVSTRPMNPENRADAWETQALNGFTRPGDFVFERHSQQGDLHYRYIGPVFMQEACLSCHGTDGVEVGDLRGGISVTVNAQPIEDAQADSRWWVALTHLGGFLLLAGSTAFLLHQLRRHWGLLTEARDRLKRQENFLSGITDTMGEGCVVVDRDGVVTFVNPETEWILGWEAEQMIGRRWLDLVTPKAADERPAPERALFRTMRDGMIRREEDESLLHKDGFLIPVAYSVSAMQEGERVTGAVLTFNDISERKRAEEDRSRLERQLNQTHKMEAVGQLAGGIAHEINTPIQYIGENLRFLLESDEDMGQLFEAYRELLERAEGVERLQPQLEKIKAVMEEIDFDYLREETSKSIEQSLSGAEQVARIVLAMKEFAHPGSHRMAPADLNKIIRNTVAVCRNEWKYVADTELELDPDLPEVDCLGGELSQVVMNLVVNAAHAIEAARREEKGVITIRSARRNGQVELRIADTGTGIPEAVRDSVFNPFFTTKDVGKGTGQGLTIAQDIVVGKHHGELFFETETGRGTTFVIRLPLSQPAGAGQVG